ncbi:MAG: glycoside hydrolase family 127 protein [Clostridia bacterium]|nr:glycoside hydrolase family 127 protein [Clostridia bacterium]
MKFPYESLHRFPLGSLRANGFLYEQMRRCKEGFGGHLDELEPGMIADPFVNKSYVPMWGDGDQSGWGAEISGNYWTGMIEMAFTMQNETLIEKVTDWVNAMTAKQREDGYLGTYYEPDADIYEDYNAWGTAGAMRGLLAFYEATGREDVFRAVYRCMKWFAKTWTGEHKTGYVGGLIMEPMLFCYAYTKDPELLQFAYDYAEYLVEHDIFSSSYKSFLEKELEYTSNHSAAYGVMTRLPALLYAADGGEQYLRASRRILANIKKKATNLNGGVVSNQEFLGPPSGISETEYCTYTFFNATFSYMSHITGDASYGDDMEQAFYNGVQGARKKDERAMAYMSAPNQIMATDKSSFTHDYFQVYAPCHPVSCCPVNAVTVLPEFVRGMMLYDDDGGLYLSVYGPVTLETESLSVREETMYPFRDTVTLHIDRCEKENLKTVALRIPGWCKAYTVRVNGESVNTEADLHGYAHITRAWIAGDTVSVTFHMETQVVRVDDSDMAGKYPIAIVRGPLLYALHPAEAWCPYLGTPCTPLPEGWSWYRVVTKHDEADCRDHHDRTGMRRWYTPFNVALDETLSPDDITVEELDIPCDAYPWECPPVKLYLKGYRAPYLYPPYPACSIEPYGDRQTVTEEMELALEPYGCTNLRISYFPRAKL